MPWMQTCPIDQKIKFVAAVKTGIYSFAEVCRQFGVSRKSGYGLLERYESEGARGLLPRSRAAHNHPGAMEQAMVGRLLEIKRRYPKLGPRKVLDRMRLEGATQGLPAASTVGELFKRHGLVHSRKPRRRSAPQGTPLSHASAPNAVWSVDFKGQFRLGNGRWCYPLTLSDNASRYLLLCKGVERPTAQAVWPHMEGVFRQYGLPQAIRSDNGAPFASVGLAGLTRLSIWWLKLGINLERIHPGRPDQNGRHERMHRTLKDDIEAAKYTLSAQQRRFDRFEHYYNSVRPHEALGGVPPSYCYVPSNRAYPSRVPDPIYRDSVAVRRVRNTGQIKWQGHFVFVSEALIGEPVGLIPLEQDRWQLWFCNLTLGVLNMRNKKIERLN
jgi:putative transposase